MEQINYNLLFRWFVGLGIDDAVWDHSTFSKNRERLLGADVAAKFLAAVLRHPKVTRFLSDEHFSVDGTLVEAWASLKSSAPRTVQTSHPRQGATASGISTTRSAATRRMPRPRTRMPGFIAKAAARLPSSATWDML